MKIGILFDLDGTLLDTLGDLTDSVNHVMEEFGYPRRTQQEIRGFLGSGAESLIRYSVPAQADHMPAFLQFRKWYPVHSRIKTVPYTGIPEALAQLGKNYPVAVVSNKPHESTKLLCDDFFPGVYALGQTPDCPRKPAPDMLRKAMKDLGVDRCIYVGDSDIDLETARNAGVPCISVTWGFRDRDVLQAAGAEYFCNNPADLPRIVEQIVQEMV